jgi:hypothetical protein
MRVSAAGRWRRRAVEGAFGVESDAVASSPARSASGSGAAASDGEKKTSSRVKTLRDGWFSAPADDGDDAHATTTTRARRGRDGGRGAESERT